MKENAKKKLPLVAVIVGSVLLAIVIAALVLSLVKVDSLNALNGYSSVSVYNLGSNDRFELEGNEYQEQRAKLDEAMKGSNFSIMQGILEGKVSGKLAFKRDANDEVIVFGDNEADGDSSDTAGFNPTTNSLVNSTANLYKIEYKFATLKTVTVEDEEIAFDRAIVLVSNSNNEIGTLEIVLYSYAEVGAEGTLEEDDEPYTVKPIVVNSRTTVIYNAIAEIFADSNR